MPAPRAGEKTPSEYHVLLQFELRLTVDGVGMARGHDDALTLVQDVLDAVDRDPTHAVEAGDHRVAAGFVGADLLALVKGEERHTQRVILRKCLAHNLTGLLRDLLFERQNRGFFNIFKAVHTVSSCL